MAGVMLVGVSLITMGLMAVVAYDPVEPNVTPGEFDTTVYELTLASVGTVKLLATTPSEL
jgi:hypothetical protein